MTEASNANAFFPTFPPGDLYNIDCREAAGRAVRLGLVGAGSIAQGKYLPALMRLRARCEPVAPVAFAEPLEAVGQKVAAQYSLRWYRNTEQMLDEAALDAALILTPDHLHAQAALECIERGVHVLVEKPLALSLAESRAVCEAAERQSVVLMTAFNKRFSPPYLHGKSLLDQGVLEAPALIAAKNCHAWCRDNMLEHQQIHLLDLMRYYGGDVATVSAVGTNRYGEANYPFDNVAATFRFTAGAIGCFYGNSVGLNQQPWERVEVYGKHVWFAVEGQYELWLYDNEQGPAKNWRPNMGNSLVFDEEYMGYTGEVLNFAHAILGRARPLCTGWDGHRALELALAVRASAETGQEIQLPLNETAASREVAPGRRGTGDTE
jgi:predicted dehydrogenase